MLNSVTVVRFKRKQQLPSHRLFFEYVIVALLLDYIIYTWVESFSFLLLFLFFIFFFFLFLSTYRITTHERLLFHLSKKQPSQFAFK